MVAERERVPHAGHATKGRAARRLCGALVAVAVLSGAAGCSEDRERSRPPSVVAPEVRCDKVAASGGRNHWSGTRERPFRTVQRLVKHLRRGETGCLRGGTYRGQVRITHGGRAGRPVTLRAYPGERVRLAGPLYLSRRAPHVTIRGLHLDGSNRQALPSPMVHARHATFVHNDVTNRHSAICFLLGSEAYGRADHARIEGNRIHHCGRLPRTNLDHGIYVEAAREALIRGNWIHDNADHGVNLYPNAQATLVTGNVIYGNGEGILFSGEDGAASSDNAVKGNVIADSRVRFNAESYWPAKNPVGRRNLLARNCLFGGPEGVVNGGVKEPTLGFKAVDNLVERPRFLNLGRRDLRLARETRCRSVLGRHTGKPGPR